MSHIYTLGYAPIDRGKPMELTLREFDMIVHSINPDILIDVRGGPTRTSGFGSKQIAARHPQYERRAAGLGNWPAWGNTVTQAGLDRLVSDAYHKRIVIFCHCGLPYRRVGLSPCHRHGLIATAVHHEITVKHIFKGGPNGELFAVDSKELERWLQNGQRGIYLGEDFP